MPLDKQGPSATDVASLVTSRAIVLNRLRDHVLQLHVSRVRTRKRQLHMQLSTRNCRRRKFPLQMQSEEPGESPLHQSGGPGEVVGNWEPAGSQYDWDGRETRRKTPRTMLMKWVPLNRGT